MTHIFVNYRHADSRPNTLILANKLKQEFGENFVFIDVDDMVAGNWTEQIEEQLNKSKVFLCIMGPEWLKLQNTESGQRRLDEENDVVRREIEYALSHTKTIISVRLEKVEIPPRTSLPKSIQSLVDHQSVQVRFEDTRTLESDISHLFKLIKASVSASKDASESLLRPLLRNLVDSRSDLERYNIARRTVLGYIRENKQVNGDTMRLIQLHVGLVVGYTLRLLKEHWSDELAGQVRKLAVDNALDFSDPFDRSKLASEFALALGLANDEQLRDAFENGLSYAIPMNLVPVPLLRFGLGAAYKSTATVVNGLTVSGVAIAGSLDAVSLEELSKLLLDVEGRLLRQIKS